MRLPVTGPAGDLDCDQPVSLSLGSCPAPGHAPYSQPGHVPRVSSHVYSFRVSPSPRHNFYVATVVIHIILYYYYKHRYHTPAPVSFNFKQLLEQETKKVIKMPQYLAIRAPTFIQLTNWIPVRLTIDSVTNSKTLSVPPKLLMCLCRKKYDLCCVSLGLQSR